MHDLRLEKVAKDIVYMHTHIKWKRPVVIGKHNCNPFAFWLVSSPSRALKRARAICNEQIIG
jgi:hypothetical protein